MIRSETICGVLADAGDKLGPSAREENAERKAIKIFGENRTLKQTTEIFSDINIRLGSASFDSLL